MQTGGGRGRRGTSCTPSEEFKKLDQKNAIKHENRGAPPRFCHNHKYPPQKNFFAFENYMKFNLSYFSSGKPCCQVLVSTWLRSRRPSRDSDRRTPHPAKNSKPPLCQESVHKSWAQLPREWWLHPSGFVPIETRTPKRLSVKRNWPPETAATTTPSPTAPPWSSRQAGSSSRPLLLAVKWRPSSSNAEATASRPSPS